MNYKGIVHPKTFIGRFMSFMNALETPYAYDFWAACYLISVAVGRHVHVPRPLAPVFLNWYIMLFAASGIPRTWSPTENSDGGQSGETISYAVAPLVAKGRTLGAFALASSGGRVWNDQDRHLMLLVGR